VYADIGIVKLKIFCLLILFFVQWEFVSRRMNQQYSDNIRVTLLPLKRSSTESISSWKSSPCSSLYAPQFSGKRSRWWYVEKLWKKFQMFVWLGPIGRVTQRRISCPSECPNPMYRDIFICSDYNFRSLNVVSGEWYGEKILEIIPSVPLTETYQSSHSTSNSVP